MSENQVELKKTKKTRRLSVVYKIVLPVVALIVFFGAFATYGVYQQVFDLLLKFEKDNLKHITNEQSHETNIVIKNSQEIIRGLAGSKSLNELLLNEDLELQDKEVISIFNDYNFQEQFSAIYLMNEDGEVFASTEETFLEKNYAFRDYFKIASKGQSYIDVSVGVTSGELGYYFSELIEEDGQFLAVLVGKLKPEIIFETIIHQVQNTITIPLTSFYLLDRHGVVIFSENKDFLYKSIGAIDEDKRQLLLSEKRYGSSALTAMQYQYLQTEIDNKIITSQFDFENEAEGKKEIITMVKVEDFPFYVFTETNLDSIINPAKKVSIFIGLIVFLSAVLAMVVIYVIAYLILKPLKSLAETADHIASGQFDERVTIKGNDELGDLADSFNSMTDRLVQAKQEVEKKVELRTSELRKFKAAVEASTELVVFTDPEAIVLWGNLSVEKITGFSLEEALGIKAGYLWGNMMERAWYDDLWKTIKKEKKVFSGELQNHKKDGTKFFSILTIYPILDDDDNIEFFVATQRDITREKEIDSMKTNFISLASHQLRTPLSAMKWFLEMLLSGDLGKINKEQKDALINLDQSNERMIDLINSLLNISRIESGRMIVEPVSTDVLELVKDVSMELVGELKKKKQKAKISFDKKLTKVKTDPKLLRQVITNFIANANKYGLDGTDIKISVSQNKEDVLIEVSDQGLGISENDKNQIFNKFFRASNAIKKEADGSGLGLYLSKVIAESLGGKIGFTSQENKGSTFWLSLPLKGSKEKKGEVRLT